ncbi:antitoxin [Zafaria sp. Z1313]|uniref:antitoxin n=1 Tax=unclassified Zafaria TaxID=2828765 RepID=UPI002E77BEDC|nr:antitoxin [Zafaria sp. J156]MEE1620137.1 antitoxin [Zafaria sp. J156]
MSVFDGLKGKAGELKDKAGSLAEDGAEKLRGAVEGIGDFVDEKTGGKYAEQVDNLQDSARDLLDKVSGSDGETPAS